MTTIDPRWQEIHDERLRDLFREIHTIIMNNGVDLVRSVNNVYEFVIQLDNDRPLNIDKNLHIQNEDYVDFTIDLKTDRGVIYVGPT